MGILHTLFGWSRVPEQLRAELESEGVLYLAEKVGVSQRFSGSIPGLFSSTGGTRGSGTLAITRARVYATFPTAARLGGPAIDQRWDAAGDGPATVTISDAGVLLEIDIANVDPRFRGQLSLRYRAPLTDDVLAQLPAHTLRFSVSPEYVFHLLGVRAKT